MLQRISGPRACPQTARVIEGATLEAIVTPSTFMEAWHRVRRNKGGPGGDGVTIEVFADNLDARLEELRLRVLSQRYRPQKIRRAAMPKPDGGRRKLTIPAVVDRILQTAAMLVISPTVEGKLSGSSWAYREGRGVKDAIAELMHAREAGFLWTLDADITQYFDQVSHRRLIEDVMIWIDDVRIIRLLRMWLRGFAFWGRGIAQGSPISPLLANLFLHPMDRLLELEGFRSVRYADDFVALCRNESQATKAMKIAASHLAMRGLTLNKAKTKIVGPKGSFVFLGHTIEGIKP